jgi:hypothetical protein
MIEGFPLLNTSHGNEIGFFYSNRTTGRKWYAKLRWLMPMHGGRPWVEEWRAKRIEMGLAH